ncbi:MAG: aminotransferase class V-fold PLP-dependent enzyme [Mycoplasma sp.]
MTDEQVKKLKDDFQWFKTNPSLTYLDSSATSLKPKQVIEAINHYYNDLCVNPHNKDSVFAYNSTKILTETRQVVANLLNVKFNEVIFTPGATYSINLVANGLSKFVHENDEILLTYAEHTSNLLPWQNLAKKTKAKLVFTGSELFVKEEDLVKAITPKTKILTFANVSNVLGYNLDYKSIAKKARAINPDIIIAIDATQAVPHIRHDLKDAQIDFLAFSAHKMLGPTGIGVCYINEKWLQKIDPLVYGGGMNAIVEDNDYTYATVPDKFEGGTPNVGGIAGLGAAVNYLNSIGWDNIEQHEHNLKQYLNQELKKIPHVEYYNEAAPFPIVFFNIKGCSSQDLASYLGSKNIIVRAGLSCAKLSTKITKVPSAVRASFYLYNTKEDVDKLIKVLKEYKKGDELTHVII